MSDIQQEYIHHTEACAQLAEEIAANLDHGQQIGDIADLRVSYAKHKGWLQCYHKAALTPHPASVLGDWISMVDDMIDHAYRGAVTSDLLGNLEILRRAVVREHERTLREAP